MINLFKNKILKYCKLSFGFVLLACYVFQEDAKAHTALGKKQLSNFYAWTSCVQHPSRLSEEKILSCFFPIKGNGHKNHYDPINVYCKETKILNINRYAKSGGYKIIDPSSKSGYLKVPPFTVQMWTFHDPKMELNGILYHSDSDSPWANECRRIYPEL